MRARVVRIRDGKLPVQWDLRKLSILAAAGRARVVLRDPAVRPSTLLCQDRKAAFANLKTKYPIVGEFFESL